MCIATNASKALSQTDAFNGEFRAVIEIKGAGAGVKKDIDKLAQPNLPKEQKQAIKDEIKALDARTDELAQKYLQSDKVQTAAAVEALQSRDVTRARSYGDRAVDLAHGQQDPKALTAALTARGTAALSAGDFPQAARDARQALEIDRSDKAAMALWQFSKDRRKTNNLKFGAFDKSTDGHVDELLAELSPLNDPEVQAAGKRATDHLEALVRLKEARKFYAMGDFPAALRESAAAISLDSELPDAYMQRAIIFTALKDTAKALAEVSKAIKLWTTRGGDGRSLAPAHTLRADLNNALNEPRRALDDANHALALDPKSAAAYRARAQAREALGQKAEQVLSDFKKAADLDPALAEYYTSAVTRLNARAARPSTPGVRVRLFDALLFAGALVAFLVGGYGLKMIGSGKAKRKAVALGMRSSIDDQYDILEKIGEGGMGTVYRGWDKMLKRPIAVKSLRAELQRNERERERFIREAEMVASLRHPHIVEIYTIIRNEAATFLVFEYIVGLTLHDLLNEYPARRMPPALALDMLRQVAEAVDHAHSRRLIHRDLKPANVMIGEDGWVKVMDFGIARQVQDSLAATTNTVVGTPTYMAPEQAMGVVGPESDVFSLGCSFYEMLIGGTPFKGSNEAQDKLVGRFTLPSKLIRGLSTGFDTAFIKAFAPRPEDRYHTCFDFYRAVRAALTERVSPPV